MPLVPTPSALSVSQYLSHLFNCQHLQLSPRVGACCAARGVGCRSQRMSSPTSPQLTAHRNWWVNPPAPLPLCWDNSGVLCTGSRVVWLVWAQVLIISCSIMNALLVLLYSVAHFSSPLPKFPGITSRINCLYINSYLESTSEQPRRRDHGLVCFSLYYNFNEILDRWADSLEYFFIILILNLINQYFIIYYGPGITPGRYNN